MYYEMRAQSVLLSGRARISSATYSLASQGDSEW